MAPNSNIRWPPSALLATPPGGPQSQYRWPPAGLILTGVGVIVVSSELEEVLGLSHRVLVMSGGRQRAILDRAEATPEAVMALALSNVPRESPLESPIDGEEEFRTPISTQEN